MHRSFHQTTISLSGIACLVAAACGSQGGPPQPSMSERWRALALPPPGAEVIYADDEVLTTRHTGADVTTIADLYREALEAHGHTMSLSVGRPPLAASRWAMRSSRV